MTGNLIALSAAEDAASHPFIRGIAGHQMKAPRLKGFGQLFGTAQIPQDREEDVFQPRASGRFLRQKHRLRLNIQSRRPFWGLLPLPEPKQGNDTAAGAKIAGGFVLAGSGKAGEQKGIGSKGVVLGNTAEHTAA